MEDSDGRGVMNSVSIVDLIQNALSGGSGSDGRLNLLPESG